MVGRLSAAVAAATASFGPDDHRSLSARLALGLGLRDRGQDEEAYAELAALATDCARVLGPEQPDTLIARREAGLSCLHLSMSQDADPARLPEAVRRLEEVAEIGQRRHGTTHPDTLDVWLNLSFAYATAKRYKESTRLERVLTGWAQLVADRERELGPDAPDTQLARLRLAGRLGWGERPAAGAAGSAVLGPVGS
ncbi:tetratricopeptide repeat protein [Actinoplanes philippinensis]|uniref:tetratricopeptide repeat protein n=1 Tax=Actinoplanes philippinensis TaxID=35752 RepID=UPI00340E116E